MKKIKLDKQIIEIKEAENKILELGGKVPKRGLSKWKKLDQFKIKCPCFNDGVTGVTEVIKDLKDLVNSIDESMSSMEIAKLKANALMETIKSADEDSRVSVKVFWDDDSDINGSSNLQWDEFQIEIAEPKTNKEYLEALNKSIQTRTEAMEKQLKKKKKKETLSDVKAKLKMAEDFIKANGLKLSQDRNN